MDSHIEQSHAPLKCGNWKTSSQLKQIDFSMGVPLLVIPRWRPSHLSLQVKVAELAQNWAISGAPEAQVQVVP